jgi:hypothetical protein
VRNVRLSREGSGCRVTDPPAQEVHLEGDGTLECQDARRPGGRNGIVLAGRYVVAGAGADRVGLTAELCDALESTRERRSGHVPGRVFCDLTVMLADGGRCVSDLQALAGQSQTPQSAQPRAGASVPRGST